MREERQPGFLRHGEVVRGLSHSRFPGREDCHIINYCAHCTSHGAIPMAEWESRRTESVGATLAKYRENPKDGQAAVALLEAADFFEDEQTYASSFKEIERRCRTIPTC